MGKAKDYVKEYYQENKERILARKKKYLGNNRDKVLEQKKKWRDENKEKLKEYRKKYNNKYNRKNRDKINKRQRDRNKCDIQFNIRRRLSGCFYRAVKKYSKTEKFTISKNKNICYVAIFEALKPFPKNISNYHIDHVIPLAFFDLTNEEHMRKACNPINFQWLKGSDNIIKKDKIDFEMYPEQEAVFNELGLTERFIN